MKRLVSTLNLSKEDWLRYRKCGITGTDAGAILGLNPYRSAFQVYHDKISDTIENIDNEAMRQGRDLEDYVAQRFSEETGFKVRRVNAIYQSEEHPLLLADFDRLIVGQKAGLECKTVSPFSADKWADGEIPAHYLAQVDHYLAVSGFDCWYVAALIFGRELVIHKIVTDKQVLSDLIDKEELFWTRHVVPQIPPAPNGCDCDTQQINQLYEVDNRDKTADLSALHGLLDKRQELSDQIEQMEQEKTAIEQQVKLKMQDAAYGTAPGYKVSWVSSESKRVDSQRLRKEQPDALCVAFDLHAPTFRHKMYDGYKATRHKMPDELAAQMPVLKELLAALGYREVTAEGWEADDILGTLSAACAARSDDCFLATGDRDSLQLVNDTTTVLLATTAMGRSKTVTMDVEAVKEKYGVSPRQLIDIKSLMGDASDNIPGVKGIGEKSAVTLIQKYGSLAGVYAHLDDTSDKTIKPKQREHLAEDRAMAELSYTLGTIRTDAPIDTAEGAYAVGEGNKAEAVRLLQELEIHSLIPRFGLDNVAPATAPEEVPTEEAEIGILPLTPAGHYLVAARPAVMGKQGTKNVIVQPEAWYAVQDRTVFPLSDDELVRLQHRLGRQAGRLSAGRLGLQVSDLGAGRELPRQGSVHLRGVAGCRIPGGSVCQDESRDHGLRRGRPVP